MSIDFYRANLMNVEDGGQRRNMKTVRQSSLPPASTLVDQFGFLLNAFVTLSGNLVLIIVTKL